MSRPILANSIRTLNKLQMLILGTFCFSSTYAQTVELPNVQIITNSVLGAKGALSDTPANATLINIEDPLTNNVADILNQNLGSVSISNGVGNNYQNEVNYRGFSATSTLGAAVGLSVYFDSVRMNQPLGATVNWDLIPTNAIANINLLPGSNSIFGLNTLGGSIIINTKDGKNNEGTSIEALSGSFNRKSIKAEKGWQDQSHDADYFISAVLDHDDGYRDHSGSDAKQFFAKGRWRGDFGDSVSISSTYASSYLGGTQALPQDMLSNPNSSYTWPDSNQNNMFLLSLKANHPISDELVMNGNVYFQRLNSANLNSNAQLDDGCTNPDGTLSASTKYIGTLNPNGFKCAQQAPNGSALNSITGSAAQALGFARYTSDINTSLVTSDTKQQSWGGGLQWSDSGQILSHNNTLIYGGLIDFSRITYSQNTYLARLINYQTVVIPNMEYGYTANGQAASLTNLPNQFTGSNVLNQVNLSSNTSGLNTYLINTIEMTKHLKWNLSASLNWVNLNQSGSNDQFLNDDGGYSWTDSVSGVSYYNPNYVNAYKYSNSSPGYASQNGVPSGALAGPESNSLVGNHRFHRINPSSGIIFDLSAKTNLFANYSESMRTPTSVELSCANPINPCALPTGFNGDPELKAVVAKTIEIGARGILGSKTIWNAAIYDSKLNNDIQFIATSSTYGYFDNVGDTERRGFETGIHKKFDHLTVSANYGYVNAIYRTPFTTTTGIQVVSGNQIPGIANQTFKLRSAYTANSNWMVGLSMNAVGPQWMHGNENNADPNARVPGYVTFNLDSSLHINDQLSIFTLINNLFDKSYSTFGLSGMTSVYTLNNQNFLTPAPPRAILIGVRYSLGKNTTH